MAQPDSPNTAAPAQATGEATQSLPAAADTSAERREDLFVGANADTAARRDAALLGWVRYLAWVFLALVLGFSIFLSVVVSNNAGDVLMNKQYEYASLLSDNLNHQIYRRFALPTFVGFGRIALRNPAQYERLDLLIQQVVHGMNVESLRIYDHENRVSYSLDKEELGRDDMGSPEVAAAMGGSSDPIFRLDSRYSMLRAFFSPDMEKGSFVLRTTAPLRIETRLSSSEEEGPIMGVLEFRQDITADVATMMHLQRGVIGIILASSLLIFCILIFFLRRADKALAARMQEKEALLEKLHQHEKLAGMGRVIAGIAHEIRNPLGIICSSAQFLIQRTKETDKTGAGILQAIFDESRRLSQTVTDFLDYARPRTPRHDSVLPANVLNQALVFLQPELRLKEVEVILDFPPESEVLQVMGDKDLLYRAFYNILGNAVQAVADEKGPRRIHVRIAALPHRHGEDGEAEIVFTDSGPGFEGDLRRFLDPFFTTKPNGSGLGLPIVNSIITSHRGRLELGNRDDGQPGARIRVILPLMK